MPRTRQKQEPSPPAVSYDRVVSISGEFQPDKISQEELRLARGAFEILWIATQRAHRMALEIDRRIENGAAIERGKWAFCPVMQWVCSPREVQKP
jgi:hypothetical protein